MATAIFSQTPKIIFFDDFCDVLPNKINISDLKGNDEDAKGYKAVKNIESILNCDLTDLDTPSDQRSAKTQDSFNSRLTADFNERWRQKIFEDNEVQIEIKYMQGGGKEAGSYLNFFILTKNLEYLTPAQRSKGFTWFLSFYLQLKAESKDTDKLIILVDEPGLYLHSKAQSDIKNLFEELAEKDQILYSTHSPYLIDADKLNRVRLVINNRELGTIIEKITTRRADGKIVDALKPIIDAMGMETAHYFTPADKKNVIVEGISDFYYFHAMRNILGENGEYSILPSMGVGNVHLLMELCIGWGLEWVIIMDDERQSDRAFKKISEKFPEEAEKLVCRFVGCTGIEDTFAHKDLSLVEPNLTFTPGKNNAEIISSNGGKELFARRFMEMVNSRSITEEQLSKKCKDHFKKIFSFINKNLVDEQ